MVLEAAEVIKKAVYEGTSRTKALCKPRGTSGSRLQGPVNKKRTPSEYKWGVLDPGAVVPIQKDCTRFE